MEDVPNAKMDTIWIEIIDAKSYRFGVSRLMINMFALNVLKAITLIKTINAYLFTARK